MLKSIFIRCLLLSCSVIIVKCKSINRIEPIAAFSCPVKQGMIRKRSAIERVNRTPTYALYLVPPDGNVYSSSPGTVDTVQAISGLQVVFVKYGVYMFLYARLTETTLFKGSIIKEGEIIGTVTSGHPFYFSISKSGTRVDPSKFLSCKFINGED
jgi:hypothetical protein